MYVGLIAKTMNFNLSDLNFVSCVLNLMVLKLKNYRPVSAFRVKDHSPSFTNDPLGQTYRSTFAVSIRFGPERDGKLTY